MPCLNNATCIDLIANYTCSCPSGFTGLHCESRIDYCGEANCTQNGVCVNLFTGKSHSKAWILCNRSYHLVASISVYMKTWFYSHYFDRPNGPLAARSPQLVLGSLTVTWYKNTLHARKRRSGIHWKEGKVAF